MVVLEKGLSGALNAKVTGSGDEAIILAHGFGGDQSVWDKILPYLAKHCRVLVFDWIFSGAVQDPSLFDPVKYSSYDAFANDLISLIDELNLKSSVFVGHSMSGMIGCIASIKRPDLFKRLILVGASPRYINADGYEGGFNNAEIEDIISNMESNFYNWAQAFASAVVDAKDPPSVDMFSKCLLRMRPEFAVPVAKTVFYSDERDILEKVMTPCIIVQTTRDIVVPNSVAYYMQEKIKGKSTVEIIETDGHFPHLTAHLQLLDVLTAVMNLNEPENIST
ncbi:hypothetical protein SADUNF_Sadunf06G0129000 [Salix dunnii]|uniref:AB hydrolase-1 domain-containing protein n=1 Tax=Salix dunnii TaxID=1413687 RepID=A0A835N0S1_9ROSI|nr:hypothetical protein SADUNF_Sadunf06G0129000 [Salix dunnii]